MPGYKKDVAKIIVKKLKKGGKVEKKKKKEEEKEYGHKDFPGRAGFKMREERAKGKKHGGEMKYAEGGKVELTPDAKKIPKELEKASQMHKGQAERLKKLGFKHGGEAHDKKMSYGHGGDVKYGHGGEAEKKKMKHGGAIHSPVKAEPKDVLRTKRGVKPDFLDIDKDGDKKESMKKASEDKKKKKMKHGGEMKYGHGGMVMKIVKKLKDK